MKTSTSIIRVIYRAKFFAYESHESQGDVSGNDDRPAIVEAVEKVAIPYKN
jgi:hypothetical protein